MNSAYDETLERQLVKKVFRRIIPFMFMLYIAAFLDRVNVSFAALSMNKDLGFSSAIYGMGAGIFFLGYVLLEIPGNLLMTKVGPRIWMTRILVTWGVIAGLTAFIRTPVQFYTVRFFLGMAEASFTPGILYYLGNWFRQKDLGKAVALFLTAMPTCNLIAAPISTYLLGVHWFGWAGWKWLFVFEALPAVVLGVVCFFYLTDVPEQANWLKPDERALLVRLMNEEKAAKLQKKTYRLGQAFADPDVIKLSAVYFTWVTGLYGVTMFLPTLVKGLQQSMSNQRVGYLVMIPYLAALIATVLVGRHSDAVNERRFHVAACMIFSALALGGSVWLAHVSLSLALGLYAVSMMGVNAAFGPFWAIPSSFLQGAGAAGAIAMINSIGNVGGFVGPYALGYIREATGSYNAGILLMAGSLVISALLVISLKKTGKAIEPARPAQANTVTAPVYRPT